MIIVPAAPVIFCLAFGFKWEVMQNSAHMRPPLFNNVMKVLLRISIDSRTSIVIDLQSEEGAHFDHQF